MVINRLEDLNAIWNQGLKALQERQNVPVDKKLKADFDSSDSENE